LREEIARMRLLAKNVPIAVAYFEAVGLTCRYANPRYARMFGLDESSVLGCHFREIVGEEGAEQVQPYAETLLREGVPVRYEREITNARGQPVWIEVQMVPHTEEGVIRGAFVLVTDITRHRNAEAAVRESEERLAKFMHASQEGIVFHQDGVITDVNPPALALLGYTAEEMLGRMTLEFVPPEARAQVMAVLVAAPEIRYDSIALHKDGSRVPVEYIVRSMQFKGERQRMIIVRDIRARVEAEARIQHIAHHDALTGLLNRTAFADTAAQRLARARTQGQSVALMFLDLDHFKRINDSLGHPVGDLLLKTVAERIAGALREGDLVSRFGGDEFVVLLAPRAGQPAVAEVATRLMAAVGAPVQVQGATISVTPSIGVALFPQDGDSVEELVKHADLAMYQSKDQGRARLRFFQARLAEAARADLVLEAELAHAVREQQFLLHYQPQLGRDGRTIGLEALVRWVHPERGPVGPNHFIPLAEARRLILPIGEMVLRQALRAAVQWRSAGLLTAPVAVNLSSQQFRAPGFVDGIARALKAAGAHGAMLELELTERMLMDDIEAVRERLVQLKALGVTIAVDDFGTGYTSLGHLRHLPIDRLKVDRSFVKDLPGDERSAALMRAIVQMAQALGLEVVAEGVETIEQRDWVVAQGCEGWQGYFGARPMPAAVLEAWLRERLPQHPSGPGFNKS
jgi:diguanylate cyclase (GGDEF)-like protein/PAS domain S-box-containing protein